MKIRAAAHVEVKVLVRCGSTWGPDCTIDQVHKQAASEALKILEEVSVETSGQVVVTGKPFVKTVMTEVE